MNIDIIFSHKNRDGTRKRNLEFALTYYHKHINTDIIANFYVVEQDSDTDLTKYSYVNHIKFKTSYDFSKSQCFNLGFKNSNSDYLILLDNDVIIEKYILENITDYLKQNTLFIPYDKPVIMLSEKETQQAINSFNLKGGIPRKFMNVGGINIVSRQMYFNVGGHEPDFIGWGFEDAAFMHKIRKLYSVERVPGNLYHLFHKRKHKDLDNPNFKYTKAQSKKIYNFNKKELIEYINSLGTAHLI